MEDFLGNRLLTVNASASCDSYLIQLIPNVRSIASRKEFLSIAEKNLTFNEGSKIFSIGAFKNTIFLPNEEYELSVFLCHEQMHRWFALSSDDATLEKFKNDLIDNGFQTSSVIFDTQSDSIKITMSEYNVSINCNNLASIANCGFIEDTSRYFKNSILKNSILLVKAWCSYDSVIYFPDHSQASIFSILKSPTIIHVLVVHIFSLCGQTIHHPLQALQLFLQYYSNIDWESVVITTDQLLSSSSLLPIQAHTSLGKDKGKDTERELLAIHNVKMQYKKKYDAIVSVNSDNIRYKLNTSERYSEDLTIADEDKDCFASFDKKSPLRHSDSDVMCAYGGNSRNSTHSQRLTDNSQRTSDLEFSSIGSLEALSNVFCVSFINIMDPILGNNVSSHVTASDVQLLKQALKRGYADLSTAIKHCISAECGVDKQGVISLGNNYSVSYGEYFCSRWMSRTRNAALKEHVNSRLGWNPVLDNASFSGMVTTYEHIQADLSHAEFVFGFKIEAEVTISLIVHIIERTGPHPVGEIGKLLRESTDIPNLCKVLKKQFRGLKNFIESYPKRLQLGGSHAFNPQVYIAGTILPTVEANNTNVSTSRHSGDWQGQGGVGVGADDAAAGTAANNHRKDAYEKGKANAHNASNAGAWKSNNNSSHVTTNGVRGSAPHANRGGGGGSSIGNGNNVPPPHQYQNRNQVITGIDAHYGSSKKVLAAQQSNSKSLGNIDSYAALATGVGQESANLTYKQSTLTPKAAEWTPKYASNVPLNAPLHATQTHVAVNPKAIHGTGGSGTVPATLPLPASGAGGVKGGVTGSGAQSSQVMNNNLSQRPALYASSETLYTVGSESSVLGRGGAMKDSQSMFHSHDSVTLKNSLFADERNVERVSDLSNSDKNQWNNSWLNHLNKYDADELFTDGDDRASFMYVPPPSGSNRGTHMNAKYLGECAAGDGIDYIPKYALSYHQDSKPPTMPFNMEEETACLPDFLRNL